LKSTRPYVTDRVTGMPGFSSKLLPMPLISEHFKHGDRKLVGERFTRNGRMMPDDIAYHASWLDATGARCFQIVEAPHLELLRPWLKRWEDLIDFEIVPVMTSGDFWSKRPPSE
jgi:hypothetical protein